ncbi:Nif11-like leader peptide family natural product precursor [Chlorobium phaeovibrioides]|uniref:Nif11-like leader peptide family natural product n=1 Tax=Chlorobium phaeovibrioides TaxID=1094 RepID=A0A5M8IDP5_CHLPH|nr:Nif11-like leader peptide family natural product precursor [Chlorobium phaeovibrioides]KAA6232580.1 Nif11-like leader peptide family natural product precursor [Chlorobium phaeovibrioides]KAA6232582.1 Nif11-like leader peptide family natural product precursor [Chlorobium phaeovibrioides]
MSVEQAKAFIEKMKTDEAFREKIMAIVTPEERLKAIGAAGFECTGEEINEAGSHLGQGLWGRVSYGYVMVYSPYCRI